MDNRTKILIAFPFVFIIILFIAAAGVPFREEVTGAEEQILAFSAAGLDIRETPAVSFAGEINIPMKFDIPETVVTAAAESDTAPGNNYNNSSVSLIVVSGKRKMAVIRGVIVREGDSFDGMKIAEIGPDRVLLKNKTEKWLYLEKTK
ncbi:MAG: hypothetical protein C4526_00375 [Nitrospiraceae bacterium]|nr:MAG: hypothetical protein C4526_00375 [Nitrospiraceae bacterium]